ncbi:MAG: hypothetical protein CMD23_00480 [Flavobacteriales bacterium]|nr:hypothetical protein [Flavobacteriales bacterium]
MDSKLEFNNLNIFYMNKYILSLIVLSFSFSIFSQEDTTFVQAHDYVDLDWNGNYDAWAVFPDGTQSYRKILMHYDMRCSSSGCSGWDYTTKIIILKDTGQVDENGNTVFSNDQTLANVVTPYGTYMQGNGTEGFSPNWVQRYTYDVTDFAHLLVDSVKMRAFYGGWSTGFNVTLNFEFIEGTPPRNVLNVQNLWSGSGSYASMSSVLTDTVLFIPDNAKNSAMRVTISGHGQDGEFTSGVYYHIKLDETSLYSQEIWRDDCGEVALYPQGGTWIYDRANWCPGDKATTRKHELTSFLSTGQDNVLDFDIYKPNWNPPEASYIYDVQLITYEEPNFNLDAVMEDIIAPSIKQDHFRFNPTCSNPIVKIKNQGVETLTTAYIVYGFNGFDTNTYFWEGDLDFGESEIIELPPIQWYSWDENLSFYARINMPNGAPEDDYLVNDVLYSDYEFVAEYPNTFAMWFKTNNVPNESSYELRDNQGNLIFSKTGMAANTLYKDTFDLEPGCYKFQILDTGGNQGWNEDGLSWWANNDGSGYARLREVPGGFFKYYQADFGTELTDFFRVGEYSVTLSEELSETLIEIYPNPAKNLLKIDLEFQTNHDVKILITDLTGKIISQNIRPDFIKGELIIDLANIQNGLYNCSVITDLEVHNQSVLILR